MTRKGILLRKTEKSKLQEWFCVYNYTYSVKFTHKGEIIVTFRQMMLKDDKVDLMISVHDTGIGMETEFINRIFSPI